jgi:hypothetical protein
MAETGFAHLPLDPGRAVAWIDAEVNAAAERDLSVAAAKALVEERLGALDDAETTTLAAILWIWLREHLLSHPFGGSALGGVLVGTPPALRAIRIGLADGDALLRVVQRSLDTTLTVDVLKRTARETREMANVDTRKTGLLNEAEVELHGGIDTDVTAHAAAAAAVGVALVVGFAAGFAFGYVVDAVLP